MASKAVLRALKAWNHEKSIGLGRKARERQEKGKRRSLATRTVNKLFKEGL